MTGPYAAATSFDDHELLTIVAALIASQLYLHSLLILFPIAFLVPIVQPLWVQSADLVFGGWYWRTFGQTHRSVCGS